jgi:hypothetical protein
MPYIFWILEQGQPRVLAVMDQMFASNGESQRHTYKQFRKIVGKATADAALRRYFRTLDAA